MTCRCFSKARSTETIDLGRIGFRTIDLDRDAGGHGFGLIVNDTPIFCRGVCWTPLDIARLSADPLEYRAALRLLADAGVNMVRVSGTMAYESEHFHDVCDELGLLVWQDLMFARMDYPWQDEMFRRGVATEVTGVLQDLQSRPSLAVICGNSEVDQQAAMLGLRRRMSRTRRVTPSSPILCALVPRRQSGCRCRLAAVSCPFMSMPA